MNEYEVRIIPTVEYETDTLESGLNEFAKMFAKRATGKVKFIADTSLAKKQVQQLVGESRVANVEVNLEPRSIKEVHSAIRKGLEEIENLGNVVYEFESKGADRTAQDFEKHRNALVEIRKEQEKLIQAQQEFNQFSDAERKGFALEKTELRELKMLNDALISTDEQLKELERAFKNAKFPALNVPIDATEKQLEALFLRVAEILSNNKLEARLQMNDDSIRETVASVEELRGWLNALGLNTEDLQRLTGDSNLTQTLQDVKNETKEVIAIKEELANVLAKVEKRYEEISAAQERHEDKMPEQRDNESDDRFSEREEKWQEKLDTLEGRVEQLENLRDTISEILSSSFDKQEIISSLQDIQTQIEELSASYEKITKDVEKFQNVTLGAVGKMQALAGNMQETNPETTGTATFEKTPAISSEAVRQATNQAIDEASQTAQEKPVELPIVITEKFAEEALQNIGLAVAKIVAEGEAAQKRLDELGPDKNLVIPADVKAEAERLRYSNEQKAERIALLKAQGRYVTKGIKKIQAEREEREHLNKVLARYNELKSGDFESVESALDGTVDRKYLNTTGYNEIIGQLRSLQSEALEAQGKLNEFLGVHIVDATHPYVKSLVDVIERFNAGLQQAGDAARKTLGMRSNVGSVATPQLDIGNAAGVGTTDLIDKTREQEFLARANAKAEEAAKQLAAAAEKTMEQVLTKISDVLAQRIIPEALQEFYPSSDVNWVKAWVEDLAKELVFNPEDFKNPVKEVLTVDKAHLEPLAKKTVETVMQALQDEIVNAELPALEIPLDKLINADADDVIQNAKLTMGSIMESLVNWDYADTINSGTSFKFVERLEAAAHRVQHEINVISKQYKEVTELANKIPDSDDDSRLRDLGSDEVKRMFEQSSYQLDELNNDFVALIAILEHFHKLVKTPVRFQVDVDELKAMHKNMLFDLDLLKGAEGETIARAIKLEEGDIPTVKGKLHLNLDSTSAEDALSAFTKSFKDASEQLRLEANIPFNIKDFGIESLEKFLHMLNSGDFSENDFSKMTADLQNFVNFLEQATEKKLILKNAPPTSEKPESAPQLDSEADSVANLNQQWGNHPDALKEATEAEAKKLAISKELEAQLLREAEAFDKRGEAIKNSHTEDNSGVKTTSTPVLDVGIGNIKFDTRKTAPEDLRSQLQQIFDDALGRDGDFAAARVKVEVDKDDVTNALITFKDNFGQTIQQLYQMTGEESEKTFTHIKTTMTAIADTFDAAFQQQNALGEIEKLSKSVDYLNFDFNELKKNANAIEDATSLQHFTNELKLMKSAVAATKAELKGFNRLDPVAAMQKAIEGGGLQNKINALRDSVKELSQSGFQEVNADGITTLEASFESANKQLNDFIASKDGMSNDELVKSYNELVLAVSLAEGGLKNLNRERANHKKSVEEQIRQVKELAQVNRQLSNMDKSDVRFPGLEQRRSILENNLKLYEGLKRSAEELNRIEVAQHSSTGTAKGGAPSKPIHADQLQLYKANISALESQLARLQIGVDTSGSVNSINAVKMAIRDLKTAYSALEQASKQGLDTREQAEQHKLSTQLATNAVKDLKRELGDVRDFGNIQQQLLDINNDLDKMGINWSAFKADPAIMQSWAGLKDGTNEAMNSFTSLEQAGERSSSQIQQLKERVRQLAAAKKSLKLEIAAAGKAKLTFGDTVMATGKKFSAYLTSLFGFNRVITMFRNAWQYVKEIDRAMTALRRVTAETSWTYNQFLDDAYRRAQRLGTSVSQIVNATADFARVGFSLEESEMLADAATLLNNISNVGTESLPMERGVQGIISIMKAFNIEASEAIHIVDSLNEVGNNFAISAAGLNEALFRSSAALAAAGNTMEQAIGLVVSANEIVQNPEVVGTALRTLSMRLRNTAGELEELGIESDGAAESITKLQTQLLNLTDGRVDIMSSADEFKSTFEILQEIANVWGDLTDIQQAEVTRLVAGVRQGQVMAAYKQYRSSNVNPIAQGCRFSYGIKLVA